MCCRGWLHPLHSRLRTTPPCCTVLDKGHGQDGFSVEFACTLRNVPADMGVSRQCLAKRSEDLVSFTFVLKPTCVPTQLAPDQSGCCENKQGKNSWSDGIPNWHAPNRAIFRLSSGVQFCDRLSCSLFAPSDKRCECHRDSIASDVSQNTIVNLFLVSA